MEDSSGGSSSSGRRRRKEVCEIEDLQEKKVWAMIKAREGSSSNSNSKTRNKWEHGPPSSSSLSSSSACNVDATTTDILAAKGAARHHSSAPLDIPQGWSKIFKKKSKKKLWDEDACDGLNGGDKVEREEDEKMGPPHEYLARRLATTKMASHSMCEGIGRTLKGRDLSKLRDAILTKTGFIE